MRKGLEKCFADFVLEIAICSEKITSLWGIAQPKEPEELIRKLQKEKLQRNA